MQLFLLKLSVPRSWEKLFFKDWKKKRAANTLKLSHWRKFKRNRNRAKKFVGRQRHINCTMCSWHLGRIRGKTMIGAWTSNYTYLRLAVNGLVLGEVSDIRSVELCPLFNEHRASLASGCRTCRAIKPFFHSDYAIVIRVRDIKNVAAKKKKVRVFSILVYGEPDCGHLPRFTGLSGKAVSIFVQYTKIILLTRKTWMTQSSAESQTSLDVCNHRSNCTRRCCYIVVERVSNVCDLK